MTDNQIKELASMYYSAVERKITADEFITELKAVNFNSFSKIYTLRNENPIFIEHLEKLKNS